MNEIIRVCIKSLTDTVKNQGIAIRELEKNLRGKPSREEIENSLNFKANNEDIFQAINNLSQELFNRPTNEEIYKVLDEKMNKNELIYYLNQKPNMEDINLLLNDKINIRDKNNYNDISHKFDLFKNDIINKMNNIDNNYVKKNDIINLQNEIDNKANIIDVENALETKEDKDKINLLLKNKLDKNDIDKFMENKLDKNDFIIEINKKMDEKLDKNNFEQFLEEYNNNMNNYNLGDNIKNKVDIKEFKLLNDSYMDNKQKMLKKINDIDNDLDRFIESVKEQFQSLNIVINNLEQNKIDNNEIDIEKLKNLDNFLKNKVEQKDVEILVNKVKNNLLDTINNFKNGENANMKMFEENIQNKIDKIIFDNQSMLNDITNTNQNINNYFTQKEAEMESLMTRMRLMINNNEIYGNNNLNNINNNSNKLQDEIIKIDVRNMIENNNNKINQKLNDKLDISKFEEFLNGLKEDLDNKVNILIMKKANEDVITEINNKIRELYTDINTELSNKISKNEMESILSNKLNNNHNNNSYNNNLLNNNLLNEKLSINDFKEYMDNISLELKQKLDINKFNNIITTFNSNFENIHKDINSKADIKSIIDLLKTKIDNDTFNKIIKNLQKEIGNKLSTNDFSNAMDNQALINDTLCKENNIGRWLWKSGKVKNNLSVPWEEQIINTSPDNYIWDEDKPIIIINEGGLYEINMGFYADKKPMVQIMVNGEVVISAINSNSFVIHQSPGGRMKGTGKTSFGNVTGLTMVDFIFLPDKAKLSISYTGEKGVGFLGLKKL